MALCRLCGGAAHRDAKESTLMEHLSAELHASAAVGPPIFLVHGMLSSADHWVPNLAALAQIGQPVSLELWGHGRSPTPSDPSRYRVAAYVEEFEFLRRQLGAPRVLVCGHSFGGALVLHYALAHPEAVLAAVFTNSVTALQPLSPAAGRNAVARQLELGERQALEALPFHPMHAKRLPMLVREQLVAAAARASPRAVAMTMLHSAPTLYLGPRVGSIQVPVLLVNGTAERSFQPLRHQLAQTAPRIEIVDAPGGHSVNLESPGEFNAAVTAFLARAIAGVA